VQNSGTNSFSGADAVCPFTDSKDLAAGID
jgi:hypothetical protein